MLSKKKKILWLCGLPYKVQTEALGGNDFGAYNSWSWIVSHFPPPQNIELHVATIWPGGKKYIKFEYNNVFFHILPCPRGFRLFLIFIFDLFVYKKLYSELKPDVVHGWGTENSFTWTAFRLGKKKSVIEIQGLQKIYQKYQEHLRWRGALVGVLENYMLNKAHYIIAESNYSKSEAAKITSRKITVIEQPIRECFLTSEPGRNSKKQVLFIGSLVERKGWRDAINAFKLACIEDWCFTLIGAGNNVDVQEEIQSLNLTNSVKWIQFADEREIIAQMQNSSVFLLPSFLDTGPNALKEALCMGLYPVCYNNSGPAEYIKKFNYGVTVQTGNVEKLAEQLRNVCIEKPWAKDGMMNQVLGKTRTVFSAKNAWEKLDDLYENVMKKVS